MKGSWGRGLLLALVCTGLTACGGSGGGSGATGLAGYVRPLAGTGTTQDRFSAVGGAVAHTFPGAVVPFGMLQWSPDTIPDETNPAGGYDYSDSKIRGFSLHHISGAGCAIYQDVPFLPTTAPIIRSPIDPDASGVTSWRATYIPRFDHQHEQATPGYYRVLLNPGSGQPINVQIAADTRSGIARFTFPETDHASVLVNAGGSAQGGLGFGNSAAAVHIDPAHDEVSGHATSGHFCVHDNTYSIYFVARFNRDFSAYGTWKKQTLSPGNTAESDDDAKAKTGAYVTFDTSANRRVVARVGISFVSVDNARKNLTAEIGNADLGAVHTRANRAWNRALGRVEISGGSARNRQTFYTALYHAMIDPSTFSDHNGEYMGMDGKIHQTAAGHTQYMDIGSWDIYRAQFPLMALLFPRRASDVIRSLLAYRAQTGYLSAFTIADAPESIMVGDSPAILIAEAYALGARDFDHDRALRAMTAGATDLSQLANTDYVERPGLDRYLNLGYIPLELNFGGGNAQDGYKTGGYAAVLDPANVWGSGATTLEYALDDFAISRYAREIGHTVDCRTFLKRSANWENLFNPATKYLQPRHADGAFPGTLDPTSAKGWVEGSTAQYTWFVPYNRTGLFHRMGDRKSVSRRLDDFFNQLNAGPVSRHAFLGNEPSLGIPWDYLWLGEPWKTQAVVRRAILSLYGVQPLDSMPGNDDTGTLSAWYVFAALGVYPAIPGTDIMAVGSPLFPHATLHLPGGDARISAPNAAPDKPYVQDLMLDGKSHGKPWLRLHAGMELRFSLAAAPDRDWGSDPSIVPPAFSPGDAAACAP